MTMRRIRVCQLLAVCAVVAAPSALGCAATAQVAQPAAKSADGVWQVPAERPRAGPEIRGQAVVVRLDKAAFDELMRGTRGPTAAEGVIIALPMPDGTFARFRAKESSILSDSLAAAFPELRTYTGQGLDDPTATTRFGWTAAGFHAIVIGQSGSVYIDPYERGNVEYYVSFRKAD
jgi:hypothetical protein